MEAFSFLNTERQDKSLDLTLSRKCQKLQKVAEMRSNTVYGYSAPVRPGNRMVLGSAELSCTLCKALKHSLSQCARGNGELFTGVMVFGQISNLESTAQCDNGDSSWE